MTQERVTATLDSELVKEVRRLAGPRGVSAFLNEATRSKLRKMKILQLLDEFDEEYGKAPNAVEIAAEAERLYG